MDSEDFITFVCRELNHSDPADGFDTFEVGSVKIEPTQWHKPSKLIPPHADARDAVIRQILERPVLIKKDHAEPKSCRVIKKGVERKSCKVIMNNYGAKVSSNINPTVIAKRVEDRVLGSSKLEVTKRKLREQYEKIENEKKKRRIQIIEFQKPVDQVQTKAKKPPVKKQIIKKKRSGPFMPTITQLHRARRVSIF